MRVSVRKNDPGFREDYYNFRVILDGRDVTPLCHTADEEEGRVYGYVVNEHGHKFVDPITDRPAEQILFGNVRIIELMNGSRQ